MKSTALSFVLTIFISILFLSGCGLLAPIVNPLGSSPDGSGSPTDGSTDPNDPDGSGGTTTFPISFAAPSDWFTATQPILVAANDFDGLLDPDILSLNAGSDDISSIINKSSGAYEVSEQYASGASPIDWVFGDFDDTNGPDVATVNQVDNNMTVFLNDGNGAFAPTNVATAAKPVAIALSDFNADGFPDLVVADNTAGEVEVFLNDTNGVFSAAADSPLSVGTLPLAIAVGDFNGDSNQDIVVANSSDASITVLYGDGDGTFSTLGSLTKSVETTPTALVVRDFDGVNGQDVAVVNKGSDSIAVLLNDGTGDFADANIYDVGSEPTRIDSVDLNGDSAPDIVVLNQNGDSISVLLNDVGGSGGTGQFVASVNYDAGQNPDSMVLADMNSDDVDDVIVSNFSSNTVSVFLNDGAGVFESSATFATGKGPKGIDVIDANQDTLMDIVTANSSDNTISILLQNAASAAEEE